MTYSRDWDETAPIDHTKFSEQPGGVRNFKTDVAERLKNFIYGFISGETDVAFKDIDFKAQASDPAAPAVTVISLYAKTVAGAAEFYLRHTTGGVIQLTSLGKILLSTLVAASQAVGDIWYASSATVMARLAGNITTSKMYLSQTGDGAAAGAPAWSLIGEGGRVGSYRNLKITRGSVTQVTVTADELCLENSSNFKVTIRSVNQTAAITTSGAGGLDTGAEGSSRYYYIWIIRKSADGTVNILLSESLTAPTMPSGYDQKALVGAVRNDGSSNFVNFIQQNDEVYYPANISQYSASPGAGSWTSVDLTSAIPSGLSDYGKFILSAGTSQASAFTNDSGVAVSIATSAPNKIQQVALAGYNPQDAIECPILTANTVYVAGSGAVVLYVAGFKINKI